MPPAMSDRALIKPLTSVRFFAALAVVIFHSGASFVSAAPHIPTPVKTLLLNGYVGVTFFFVLSGFILQLTYRSRIDSTDRIKRFGVARFARLYPVYFLAVVLMFPMNTISGWGDLPQFLLLHWWIPNGSLGWTDWNMPSWTLSVEFFFYLCFPLLSRGVERLPSAAVIAVATALLAFDAATASSAVVGNDRVMFGWMHWTPVPLLRLPEFLTGICLADLHLRGHSLRLPSWLVAAVFIVGLSLSGSPRVAAFATAMSAALIASIAANQSAAFSRILSARWLVLLGGASYALYLLQQPVHFGVVWIVGTSKVLVALQYPILIAVSIAVFLRYEEPAREWIRALAGMRPSAMEQVAGPNDP